MIQPSALVLKPISYINMSRGLLIPAVLLKIIKHEHFNNGKRSIIQ